MPSCMRAPPEEMKKMKGVFGLDRLAHGGDDGLARGHAQRAAHEGEVLHRDRHREAVELADAGLDAVVDAVLGAGFLDAVGVFALVAELQRIGRHLRHGDLLVGAVVEHGRQPHLGRHAHVIARLRHDRLVRLEVLVEHHLAGVRGPSPTCSPAPRACGPRIERIFGRTKFLIQFMGCLAPHALRDLGDERVHGLGRL